MVWREGLLNDTQSPAISYAFILRILASCFSEKNKLSSKTLHVPFLALFFLMLIQIICLFFSLETIKGGKGNGMSHVPCLVAHPLVSL